MYDNVEYNLRSGQVVPDDRMTESMAMAFKLLIRTNKNVVEEILENCCHPHVHPIDRLNRHGSDPSKTICAARRATMAAQITVC